MVHGNALDGLSEDGRAGLRRLSRVVRVWARHTADHKTEVIRALQSVGQECCDTRHVGQRVGVNFWI